MIKSVYHSILHLLFIGIISLSMISVARGQATKPAIEPLNEENLLAVMHSISSHTLLDWVTEIASPKYQGRLTGTPGYDAATDWSARLMAEWKIRPSGDAGTYLQHYPNSYTQVLPGTELDLVIPLRGGGTVLKHYRYEADFYPGATSDSGSLTAEVIYVGYGISAPELGFDDYQGLDVKGKIVLIEPESPLSPDKDQEIFKKWRAYSFHDYKVKNAAAHSAAGIVFNYHILNPNVVFIPGLLVVNAGKSVVDDLFAGTRKNHDEVVQVIRKNLRPASFPTGMTLTMTCRTQYHAEGIGSNIIGILDGSDPKLKDELIIVGGHLDHLGLAPEIFPGANDNASGSAVVLAVAKALATSEIPLKRTIVFILFGSEEQGLKGSEYYLAHPVLPNRQVKVFLNMESVGRGEKLTVIAGKNYPYLWEVIDRTNRKYIHRRVEPTFTANLARPRQDSAVFLWEGVPSLSFGSFGAKPLPFSIYHSTHDTPENITPEIMEDTARLVFLSIVELANS